MRSTYLQRTFDAQVPRVKGERVQWARSLGLEGLLAKHLPLGTFADPLSGVKAISEKELGDALDRFVEEVPAAVSAGLKALKKGLASSSSQARSTRSTLIPNSLSMGRLWASSRRSKPFIMGLRSSSARPTPRLYPVWRRSTASAETRT
jgi:hypothetical protein